MKLRIAHTLIIFALLSVLANSGCQRRYWYRQKVDLRLIKKPYQGTVYVTFVNHTPDLLIGDYEKYSVDAAYRSFKRIGLKKIDNVEKSDYHLHVEIYLDSATTRRPVGISTREYQTKAINLEFTFKDVKNKKTVHRFHHDIYFFDYPYRDVGRCAHMVKHSVLSLKDDKRPN